MEYNLLKTIEPNLNPAISSSIYPRLTPYPARDYINPGLGQISRLYSFYVPLFSSHNLHSLTKNIPENFEGSGNVNENEQGETKNDEKPIPNEQNAQEESESEPSSSTKLEKQIDDPIKYNEAKRKRLGAPIQESFLHPKLIKTNKIIFPKSKIVSKSNLIPNTNTLKKKEVQHKFQFL